jgi:hypothetical protein
MNMKRIAMVLACFALVSMTIKAQTAKVALQHNGSVTLYDADKLADALTASVDGDTLYLNEGRFAGNVTITKMVSIIGSGANTILTGNVQVSIPGTPTLTSHLLDALYLDNKSITVTLPLKGLKIRKCQFYGLNFNALTEDVTIDRCYSRGNSNASFWLSNNIKRMNVINSKVWTLRGEAEYAGDANFINCNIYNIYNWNTSENCRATYMNCIIGMWQYNNDNYAPSTTYVNCLCGSNYFVNSVNQNCWNYRTNSILDSSTNCSLSDDQLRSNNYLGTDGTVVGITGGTTPFTLVPTVPKVSDYSIKVDTQTKKLNVNIKVTAN